MTQPRSTAPNDFDFGIFGLTPDQHVRLVLEDDEGTTTNVFSADLDRGVVSPNLVDQFHANGLELSPRAGVTVLVEGSHWRVVDFMETVTYDLATPLSDASKIEVRQLAMQGATGTTPSHGADGPEGECIWGGGGCQKNGGDGQPGGNGTAGGTGGTGLNGLPSYAASIDIQTLSGYLTIKSQGADGCTGGLGGTGGTGAAGGHGGAGTKCGGTCCDGGNGGLGGNGGKGGKGGKGGNAASATTVVVSVASGEANIKRIMLPSSAGKGGQGGSGGRAGHGGAGGNASSSQGKNGNPGADGVEGELGDPGEPGNTDGSAGAIVINGKY